MHPTEALTATLRRDGARPLVTWYDDATGERVELSVATVANWAAKVANHLTDDLGLEPGDAVAVHDGQHWLAPVCVLGAWTAGVTVTDDAELRIPGEDVAAYQRAVLAQPDVVLVAAAPTELEVRSEVPPAARVLTTVSLSEALGRELLAATIAADGSLVLVRSADGDRLPRTAEVERVTHTAGVDVGALPRVG